MSLHLPNTLILDIELPTTRCKVTQHWCEVLTHRFYRLYNHQRSGAELLYVRHHKLAYRKPDWLERPRVASSSEDKVTNHMTMLNQQRLKLGVVNCPDQVKVEVYSLVSSASAALPT